MIIAFDIDDTITRHPPFFAVLSRALVEAGHQVLIITFRDDPTVTAEDLRCRPTCRWTRRRTLEVMPNRALATSRPVYSMPKAIGEVWLSRTTFRSSP